MSLTRAQREFFRNIAESLIARDTPGAQGYRRSLGPCRTFEEAAYLGEAFLRFVKRNYRDYKFGLSGIEGTGGTLNLRVRAYLVKAA